MSHCEFGLQHEIRVEHLDDDWRTLVAAQATALTTMLRRVRRAIGSIQDNAALSHEVKIQRLQDVATRAQRVLEDFAHQLVTTERQVAQFREFFGAALLSKYEHGLQDLERINDVLHINVLTARRIVRALINGKTALEGLI